MYAIIEIGGKQYKVEKGDEIKTQKVHVKEGKSYKAEGVLLLKEGRKISVGEPYLKGKTVTCEVLKHLKGKKTIAYKYKKRNGFYPQRTG